MSFVIKNSLSLNMKKETKWYYFWNPLMGNVYYSNYDEAVAVRHAYAMAGHKVGEVLCKS
jgi:hypothetical protein